MTALRLLRVLCDERRFSIVALAPWQRKWFKKAGLQGFAFFSTHHPGLLCARKSITSLGKRAGPNFNQTTPDLLPNLIGRAGCQQAQDRRRTPDFASRAPAKMMGFLTTFAGQELHSHLRAGIGCRIPSPDPEAWDLEYGSPFSGRVGILYKF